MPLPPRSPRYRECRDDGEDALAVSFPVASVRGRGRLPSDRALLRGFRERLDHYHAVRSVIDGGVAAGRTGPSGGFAGAAAGGVGGGGGGVNITVNVAGHVLTDRDLVDSVYEGLVQKGIINSSSGQLVQQA